MIFEGQIELDLAGVLSALPALSAYQIVTARNVAADTELNDEREDTVGVVAIASAYRTNDAFSLPMVNVPVTFTIMTRTEVDATSETHEAAIEAISDKLSYWHKTHDIESLNSSKFACGELRMDGGSGRVYNKAESAWQETIQINLRGSEKFEI